MDPSTELLKWKGLLNFSSQKAVYINKISVPGLLCLLWISTITEFHCFFQVLVAGFEHGQAH